VVVVAVRSEELSKSEGISLGRGARDTADTEIKTVLIALLG
jgi:hypothetical protein